MKLCRRLQEIEIPKVYIWLSRCRINLIFHCHSFFKTRINWRSNNRRALPENASDIQIRVKFNGGQIRQFRHNGLFPEDNFKRHLTKCRHPFKYVPEVGQSFGDTGHSNCTVIFHSGSFRVSDGRPEEDLGILDPRWNANLISKYSFNFTYLKWNFLKANENLDIVLSCFLLKDRPIRGVILISREKCHFLR